MRLHRSYEIPVGFWAKLDRDATSRAQALHLLAAIKRADIADEIAESKRLIDQSCCLLANRESANDRST